MKKKIVSLLFVAALSGAAVMAATNEVKPAVKQVERRTCRLNHLLNLGSPTAVRCGPRDPRKPVHRGSQQEFRRKAQA